MLRLVLVGRVWAAAHLTVGVAETHSSQPTPLKAVAEEDTAVAATDLTPVLGVLVAVAALDQTGM
jgi:hypothetical protein